jgi:hypothetical protein
MELLCLLLLALCLFFYFRNKAKKIKGTIKVFTKKHLAVLENEVTFYTNLSLEAQQDFRVRALHFLNTTQIIPYGCSIEIKDRMLIAASAIIPVFGFENWEYNNITTIYVLPSAFNKEFQYVGDDRNILGMVGEGTLQNKMVLSKQALHHGFQNTSDKKNTAIHEFIHLIDMQDGDIDGLPKILVEQPFVLPWLNLMHQKIAEIDNGGSDINPYGASSKVEFLAVASEYFFERPKLLKRKHPELYAQLAKFFRQDVA